MEENKTMEMELNETLTGEIVDKNEVELDETGSNKDAVMIGVAVVAAAGLGLYLGKKVFDKTAGKAVTKILRKHAERKAKRDGMDTDGDAVDVEFEEEVQVEN